METFNYDEAMESLDQRIAVLQRYRRMLELQRDRLGQYLQVIDARELAVASGDFDGLEEYSCQEQEAVRGLLAVQDCLAPLQKMYQSLIPGGAPEIADLEQRLERLRQEILKRNAESRNLLRAHADALKLELGKIRAVQAPAAVFSQAASSKLLNVMA